MRRAPTEHASYSDRVTAPADTRLDAHELQISAFRAMSGAQRVMAALEMSDAARQISRAGFRARHPQWTAEEVERATAAVLLGPNLSAVALRGVPPAIGAK